MIAYFVNAKTKKRYEILDLDRDTNIIRLRGPNSEFSVEYSKELFTKLGYTLIREEEKEEEDAAT